MLFSAVSNCPASAASLKLDVSALTKMACKTEVDALQADEEQHQQHGQAEIIEAAVQRQRQRHRATRQQDMMLDQLRTAVIARRAAGGVADRHGDAHHVRDRVVVAENGEEAPDAEYTGIDHGADRVTRLPMFRLLERQDRGAPFVFAHLEGADRADPDDQDRTRPQQRVAGLDRRQQRCDGGTERAEQHRPEILAHGIDQRRVKYRLQFILIAALFLIDQLHCQGTRPVRVRSSYPLQMKSF